MLDNVLKDIDRFPGSLAEYCKLKNDHYQIMNLKGDEKFIHTDEPLEILRAKKQGMCALIRYQLHKTAKHSWKEPIYFGIPVKKEKFN